MAFSKKQNPAVCIGNCETDFIYGDRMSSDFANLGLMLMFVCLSVCLLMRVLNGACLHVYVCLHCGIETKFREKIRLTCEI